MIVRELLLLLVPMFTLAEQKSECPTAFLVSFKLTIV